MPNKKLPKRSIIGTVNVVIRDASFTTVPFNALSDQE